MSTYRFPLIFAAVELAKTTGDAEYDKIAVKIADELKGKLDADDLEKAITNQGEWLKVVIK